MRAFRWLPILVVGVLAAPAAGQDVPPEPLPRVEFGLPPFHEAELENGARVLVVEQRELPFVTVSLVLPGGRAAEPVENRGLADLTAGLVTRGTRTRSAKQIDETVDFLGARLEAAAEADWTVVRIETTTSALPELMEIMADVVLNPTFPPQELDLLRRRVVSGLRVSLGQPAVLAQRALLRALYGDHPYGRVATPESLEALDRPAVLDFHSTWYRPDRALFVLAGDIDLERATMLLEESFGSWEPAPPPRVEWTPPPEADGLRVVLVNQPGSVQATLRMGHLLFRGDHREWTPLSTVNQVLGGPAGRLFRILREEHGFTYAAYSQTERRLDRGYFVASAEGRTDVAGQIAEELLAQLVRLRVEAVAPAELRDAQEFLTGLFPLQMETPQQLAEVLTMGRVFGLADTALVSYRERVFALSPEDLREVVRAHLRPEGLVLVVVGDALSLLPRLRTFGGVDVVDAEGTPLDLAELRPRGRSIPLDASGLEPLTAEYRVMVRGRLTGTITRTLEEGPAPGTMVYRGTADLGPQAVAQSVAFSVSGFEALAGAARTDHMGEISTTAVEVVGGRLRGRVESPSDSMDVDVPFPEGAVLGDMLELVLWLAAIEEGMNFDVPLVAMDTGVVYNVPYQVFGVEAVETPAGRFEAYRVQLGGPQPQTAWIRRQAPHVILRVEVADDPLTFELTSLEPGGG